jgi:predicted dehydrogenase
LQASAAAGASLAPFAIAGTKASGNILGANEEIRVAVAGLGSRGKAHIGAYRGLKNVRITYLADADRRLFEIGSKASGGRPQCVQDIRDALDDKNVDVVSIATPHHWHALMSIWACQAGKDVYVEKPLSHNISEGRKLVDAAQKYNRVVQHGTQHRSSESVAQLIAAVQSGKYGKLLVSKGYCCKPQASKTQGGIGHMNAETPPAELDFNLWLGPAPQQPFHRDLLHSNWHGCWDFGNADIGNQGIHQLDIARWAIEGATLPRGVWSVGGRFADANQTETPDALTAVFDYGETKLVFEMCSLGGDKKVARKVENEFHTSEGVIRGARFYPHHGGKPEAVQCDSAPIVTRGGPFGSFIAVVRSRDMNQINCDAEVGHYSSALCHLANISYRLGTTTAFIGGKPAIGDEKATVAAWNSFCENLSAVGLKQSESSYQLGRNLAFDAVKEIFIGDSEANAMIFRKYRSPFVVHSEV